MYYEKNCSSQSCHDTEFLLVMNNFMQYILKHTVSVKNTSVVLNLITTKFHCFTIYLNHSNRNKNSKIQVSINGQTTDRHNMIITIIVGYKDRLYKDTVAKFER